MRPIRRCATCLVRRSCQTLPVAAEEGGTDRGRPADWPALPGETTSWGSKLRRGASVFGRQIRSASYRMSKALVIPFPSCQASGRDHFANDSEIRFINPPWIEPMNQSRALRGGLTKRWHGSSACGKSTGSSCSRAITWLSNQKPNLTLFSSLPVSIDENEPSEPAVARKLPVPPEEPSETLKLEPACSEALKLFVPQLLLPSQSS
jgi:hypothetical protein